MTAFFILALSMGLVLSQRFTVLILPPVVATWIAGIVGAGLVRAWDPLSLGLAVLGVTVALEAGYLLGSCIARAPWVARRNC